MLGAGSTRLDPRTPEESEGRGNRGRRFEPPTVSRSAAQMKPNAAGAGAAKKAGESPPVGSDSQLSLGEQDRGNLLSEILSKAPIVVFLTDEKGTFLLREGRGLDGLGWAPGQHVGRNAFEMYKDHP